MEYVEIEKRPEHVAVVHLGYQRENRFSHELLDELRSNAEQDVSENYCCGLMSLASRVTT